MEDLWDNGDFIQSQSVLGGSPLASPRANKGKILFKILLTAIYYDKKHVFATEIKSEKYMTSPRPPFFVPVCASREFAWPKSFPCARYVALHCHNDEGAGQTRPSSNPGLNVAPDCVSTSTAWRDSQTFRWFEAIFSLKLRKLQVNAAFPEMGMSDKFIGNKPKPRMQVL